MPKRDPVAEILAAKARGRGRQSAGELQLMSLRHRAKERGAGKYLEYFPVAAVAALESVFRLAVRELVDHGSPYSDRAGEVVHDAKVKVPALHAFHGRKISVGEFVAHLVSFKKFDDISTTFTTLLGSPFMTAVKTVEDPWVKRVEGKTDALVLPSPGPIFEDVGALIAIRHQLAHEVPRESPVRDRAVLQRQLFSTERFAHAMTEVVSQTLHPNAPLTQWDLTIAADQAAIAAETSMNEVYTGGLAGMTGEGRQAFEVSQRAFLEYRQKAADYVGSTIGTGTMRSQMELHEHERLTRQRTDDLRRVLTSWEDPPTD